MPGAVVQGCRAAGLQGCGGQGSGVQGCVAAGLRVCRVLLPEVAVSHDGFCPPHVTENVSPAAECWPCPACPAWGDEKEQTSNTRTPEVCRGHGAMGHLPKAGSRGHGTHAVTGSARRGRTAREHPGYLSPPAWTDVRVLGSRLPSLENGTTSTAASGRLRAADRAWGTPGHTGPGTPATPEGTQRQPVSSPDCLVLRKSRNSYFFV